MDAEGHEQKKLQRDIDGQTFRQGTRETNNQRWPTGQRWQMEKETDETARDGKRQPMKDREPRTERGGKKGPEAQVGAQHPWALSGWRAEPREGCHSISMFPPGQVMSPGAGTSRGGDGARYGHRARLRWEEAPSPAPRSGLHTQQGRFTETTVSRSDPVLNGHARVQTCQPRSCVQDVARRAEIQHQATPVCWPESPYCPSSWSFPLVPRSPAWSSRTPHPPYICLLIPSPRPALHPPD